MSMLDEAKTVESVFAQQSFYKRMLLKKISFAEALREPIIDNDKYLIHYLMDFNAPEDPTGDRGRFFKELFYEFFEQAYAKETIVLSEPEALKKKSKSAYFEMKIALASSAIALAERTLAIESAQETQQNASENAYLMLLEAEKFLMITMLHRVRFETLLEAGNAWEQLEKIENANEGNHQRHSEKSKRKKRRVSDLLKHYLQKKSVESADAESNYSFKSKRELSERLSDDFLKFELTSGQDESFFQTLKTDYEKDKQEAETRKKIVEFKNDEKKKEEAAERENTGALRNSANGDGRPGTKQPVSPQIGHEPQTIYDYFKDSDGEFDEYLERLLKPRKGRKFTAANQSS